jgi:hypothetical protein
MANEDSLFGQTERQAHTSAMILQQADEIAHEDVDAALVVQYTR